jgi:hypothetical protein
MLKPFYFLVLIFLGFNLPVFSQCTPVQFSGSLTFPDTAVGLPYAAETQLYSEVIHLRIPEDTLYMGFVVPIDSAGILSITGMPSSISWVSNSETGFWPGNSYGCVVVQGTPVVGDAGNYLLSIIVSVNALGTALPYTMTYDFKVLDAAFAGLELSQNNGLQVFQNQPNPFSYTSQIQYFSPKAANIDFQVFDLVGKCVQTSQYRAEVGSNKIDFSRMDLPSGIYFYELKLDNQIVRKRMLIQ